MWTGVDVMSFPDCLDVFLCCQVFTGLSGVAVELFPDCRIRWELMVALRSGVGPVGASPSGSVVLQQLSTIIGKYVKLKCRPRFGALHRLH